MTSVNFPLMVYLAYVPFAGSLWADVILNENKRVGIPRLSLLWWSSVVAVFWPVCLFLAAVALFGWVLSIAIEWLGNTQLGKWLNEDVRP